MNDIETSLRKTLTRHASYYRQVQVDAWLAALKVTVLILGWLGLPLLAWFVLGAMLGKDPNAGFWAVIIGISLAITYWPVTPIMIGLGILASIWWMQPSE